MIIFVFDYDDTLFPTTCFLNQENIKDLDILTKSINNIISKCSFLGKVYIITNAEKAWVDLTLQKYIPNCIELKKIFSNNVISTVDSGFADFEELSQWKYYTYKHVLKNYFSDSCTHQLICFGDTLNDRFAAMGIAESFKNVVVKNILFETRPCLNKILIQHSYILDILNSLVLNENSLDLKLSIHQSESSNIIQKSCISSFDESLNKGVSSVDKECISSTSSSLNLSS